MKIKKFKRGKWFVLESGHPKLIFDTEVEADNYMGNYHFSANLEEFFLDTEVDVLEDTTDTFAGTTFEGEEVDFGEPFEDV